MIRWLLLFAAACLAAACSTHPPDDPQGVLGTLPNASFPAPHRIASGALAADDVPRLRKAGVRQVIDLRDPGEAPAFDEAAALRAAGIGYHNLPIRGSDDLTRMNAVRFDELLGDAGQQLTLVHCASSNRVGAMIALRAALLQGRSIEDALREGRRWGLRSLEPDVRERLEAWAAAPGAAATTAL